MSKKQMNKILLMVPLLVAGLLGIIIFSNAYASCEGYVYLIPQNKFAYTNSTNISTTEGAANCYEVKNQVQTMLQGIKMNQLTETNLQNQVLQQQLTSHQLAQKYHDLTLNESMAMQEGKKTAAWQSRNAELQHETQYYADHLDIDLMILNQEMQIYHQQRITNIDNIDVNQILNSPTSDWSLNAPEGMNNYTSNSTPDHSKSYLPPIKPEFANNTSGTIQQSVGIQNWEELQRYMTSNSTK